MLHIDDILVFSVLFINRLLDIIHEINFTTNKCVVAKSIIKMIVYRAFRYINCFLGAFSFTFPPFSLISLFFSHIPIRQSVGWLRTLKSGFQLYRSHKSHTSLPASKKTACYSGVNQVTKLFLI